MRYRFIEQSIQKNPFDSVEFSKAEGIILITKRGGTKKVFRAADVMEVTGYPGKLLCLETRTEFECLEVTISSRTIGEMSFHISAVSGEFEDLIKQLGR